MTFAIKVIESFVQNQKVYLGFHVHFQESGIKIIRVTVALQSGLALRSGALHFYQFSSAVPRRGPLFCFILNCIVIWFSTLT